MSIAALFLASLLGSPHCAGMCGGFVAFYSGHAKGIVPHFMYNLGRLSTYTVLGLIAGLIGYSIDEVGSVAGFQRVTLLVTAVLLIIWGLKGLFSTTPLVIGEYPKSGLFKFVNKVFKKFIVPQDGVEQENSWGLRAFLLGLMSTFLPCGWLYTFVALAAASGNPLDGAVVMAVFWLGTLPVMASMAGITRILSTRLRTYVPRVTALLLLLAGVFALTGHSGLSIVDHSHHHHHTH